MKRRPLGAGARSAMLVQFMKKLLLCLPLGLVALGCGDTGDVPTQSAKTAPTNAAPADAGPAAQPQNTGEALRNNPNLPPAAKEALMGKGR